MTTKCKVVKVAAHTRKCPTTKKKVEKKVATKKKPALSIIKCPKNTQAYRVGLVAKDGREQVTPEQYKHHISYYISKHGVSAAVAKKAITRRYISSKKAVDYWELVLAKAAMAKTRSKM